MLHSAKERRTEKQGSLVAALQQQARYRHQLFIHGPDGADAEAAKKVAELEMKMQKMRDNLASVEARELAQQVQALPAGSTWAVLTGEQHAKVRLKKQLLRGPGPEYFAAIHGRTSFLASVRDGTFFQENVMPVNLLFVCTDAASMRALTDPPVAAEGLTQKDVEFFFVTRLLGGYVASAAWVDKACSVAATGASLLVPRLCNGGLLVETAPFFFKAFLALHD